MKIAYKNYLEFLKGFESPDYEFMVEDINQNKIREFTYEEFIEQYKQNEKFKNLFDFEISVYHNISKDISKTLSNLPYSFYDISDIGNEIGMILGRHLNGKEKVDGEILNSFITGLNHGWDLSLWDNTLLDGLDEE